MTGPPTRSGKQPKNGNLFPEWVATLPRNEWQLSNGTGGNFAPDYAWGRNPGTPPRHGHTAVGNGDRHENRLDVLFAHW